MGNNLAVEVRYALGSRERYTELLMNAVPRVGDKWKEGMAMPDMESKVFAQTCCKFAPRCQYATEECRRGRPDTVELGNGRRVLCFHPLTGKA